MPVVTTNARADSAWSALLATANSLLSRQAHRFEFGSPNGHSLVRTFSRRYRYQTFIVVGSHRCHLNCRRARHRRLPDAALTKGESTVARVISFMLWGGSTVSLARGSRRKPARPHSFRSAGSQIRTATTLPATIGS